MSTVFLHVGQCGNQLGRDFWKSVSKDADVTNSHSFTDVRGIQRSIHIDSEPKVIWKLAKSMKVREKNVCCGRRGRGTNWALGYYGMQSAGDDHLLDAAVEAVRREVERCDCFNGVVLMHSLSGGTGSGLGSHLCEVLRDDYPTNYLLSCVVAPCASGESPLQHYNSLLTLSHLQRYTDGIILLHNDEILQMLQKKSDRSVSFSAMNQAMAHRLCGVFLPTETYTTRSGCSLGMEPWCLVRALCPIPALKFIHLLHRARSKLSWEGLVSQTLHGLHRYDKQGRRFSSIANVVVGRGDSAASFLAAMKRGPESKIKSAYNCVPWNPMPLDFWSARRNVLGAKDSASVTVAANYGSVVEYLQNVMAKSKVMYDEGAYLHWFWRYGASREIFEESFESISTVIEEYQSAVS